MLANDALNAPEALVLTMVLVSVADGSMTDREIGIMSGQVQTLQAFQNFTSNQLADVTNAAVTLLNEEDGLAHAGRLIRAALPDKLRETAYALACEVVAAGAASGASRWTCWTSCGGNCIWTRWSPLPSNAACGRVISVSIRQIRARSPEAEPTSGVSRPLEQMRLRRDSLTFRRSRSWPADGDPRLGRGRPA